MGHLYKVTACWYETVCVEAADENEATEKAYRESFSGSHYVGSPDDYQVERATVTENRQGDNSAIAKQANQEYTARIVKRDRRCVAGRRECIKGFANFEAALRWARATKPSKIFIYEGCNAYDPEKNVYEEETE